MEFIKLKDLRLHLFVGVVFSIIVFIILAYYRVFPLAFAVSLMLLFFILLIYISELEGLIKKYEEDHQKRVQTAYNQLNDYMKNAK